VNEAVRLLTTSSRRHGGAMLRMDGRDPRHASKSVRAQNSRTWQRPVPLRQKSASKLAWVPTIMLEACLRHDGMTNWVWQATPPRGANAPELVRVGERGAGLPRSSAFLFRGAPAPRLASFTPGEAKSRRPAPHLAAASPVPMLPSAFGKRAGETGCVTHASLRPRPRSSLSRRL